MFQTVPDNGGWCLFQAGSKLDTYRLTKEAALDFRENAFGSIGTDYETSAAAFKVDIADPANVEYLDFFKCGSKVNGVFTCHHFQPNWTEQGESDAYPRFGRLDPVKAGFIDATSSTAAPFFDQTLWNGARALTSTAIAIAISALTF